MTKKQIRNLIREEINKALKEAITDKEGNTNEVIEYLKDYVTENEDKIEPNFLMILYDLIDILEDSYPNNKISIQGCGNYFNEIASEEGNFDELSRVEEEQLEDVLLPFFGGTSKGLALM